MTDRSDLVWGIRPQAGVEPSLAHRFALIAGIIYVVGGVIGFFITGFDNFTEATDEALFGIFELSPYHNIVHIGIGALWLLAALVLTLPAALAVNFTIGVFYVLAAGLGYFGVLEFLSIDPGGFGADIFYKEDRGPVGDFYLHLVTGLVTLLFGVLLGSRRAAPQPVSQR